MRGAHSHLRESPGSLRAAAGPSGWRSTGLPTSSTTCLLLPFPTSLSGNKSPPHSGTRQSSGCKRFWKQGPASQTLHLPQGAPGLSALQLRWAPRTLETHLPQLCCPPPLAPLFPGMEGPNPNNRRVQAGSSLLGALLPLPKSSSHFFLTLS